MAQILTPPASRHTSESPEVRKETEVDASAELLQSLDTLLERYLHLLDRHQKLQADLAKRLSSGFFSLAQANYTCPPGRRYGADYYDERMKATRKVSLRTPSKETEESEDSTEAKDYGHTFAIEYTPDNRGYEQEKDKGTSESPSDTAPSDENPDHHKEGENSTRKPDNASAPENLETEFTAQKPRPIKKFGSSDPITWYGILVPPSLRSAQKSFTEAVNEHLSELANVIVEMRAFEKKIEEVRNRLNHNGS
ncbi:uncharacterized protein ACHE_70430A [Aspergillus chevalieri]|uniref:Vacuolar ATPase assembly protein VMA22 n=1 Tax=Aspergillus chevalieri TaxID=182096 RepID=A0A7R7VVJ5_ASPCH|nr:uncharacterized protein ACHE_70430A [Aspergillus chevalieri]BCR91587.1 hypothetical protein ACHE_70430A [Aspergillus chevalieri]